MPKDTLINQFMDHVLAHNDATPYPAMQANNSIFMPFAAIPHFLSNELSVDRGQRQLANLPPRRDEDTVSVAIVTGEAYILSRLPELARHADIVLIADINPLVHAHTAFLLSTLKQAETREAFQQAYFDEATNPILLGRFKTSSIATVSGKGEIQDENYAAIIDIPMLKELLGAMTHTLPNFNFLCSDQRYAACRQALLGLKVCNLRWDWLAAASAEQFMQRLGELPVRITFCHVSNVPDYDGNFAMRELMKQNKPWHSQGRVTQTLTHILVNSPQAILQFSREFRVTQYNHLHCVSVVSLEKLSQLYELRAREANSRISSYQEFNPVRDRLNFALPKELGFSTLEWRVVTELDDLFTLRLQTVDFFGQREQAVLVVRLLQAGGFTTAQLLREPTSTGARYYILIPDVSLYLSQPQPSASTAPAVSPSYRSPSSSTSSG